MPTVVDIVREHLAEQFARAGMLAPAFTEEEILAAATEEEHAERYTRAGVLRYAARRCPPGHGADNPLVLGGKEYVSGEFIPADEVARASPQEREQLDKTIPGRPPGSPEPSLPPTDPEAAPETDAEPPAGATVVKSGRGGVDQSPVKEMRSLKDKNLNEVHVLILENGQKEVWKPADGEHPGMVERTGGAWKNEILCSEIAEALGVALVPKTAAREVGNRMGSSQVFVEGDPAVKWHSRLRYDGDDQLSLAACFDILCLHTDRHEGNWMCKSEKGQVRIDLIDNATVFPEQHTFEPLPDGRPWAFNRLIGRALANNVRVHPSVAGWADKRDWLRGKLREAGKSDHAIALTLWRFDSLIAHSQPDARGNYPPIRAVWATAGISMPQGV